MALFTFSGGVHPADGKEFAKNSPITEYLPKGDVVLSLPFFFTFFSIAKKKSSHKMKTPLNTRLIIPESFLFFNVFLTIS